MLFDCVDESFWLSTCFEDSVTNFDAELKLYKDSLLKQALAVNSSDEVVTFHAEECTGNNTYGQVITGRANNGATTTGEVHVFDSKPFVLHIQFARDELQISEIIARVLKDFYQTFSSTKPVRARHFDMSGVLSPFTSKIIIIRVIQIKTTVFIPHACSPWNSSHKALALL